MIFHCLRMYWMDAPRPKIAILVVYETDKFLNKFLFRQRAPDG